MQPVSPSGEVSTTRVLSTTYTEYIYEYVYKVYDVMLRCTQILSSKRARAVIKYRRLNDLFLILYDHYDHFISCNQSRYRLNKGLHGRMSEYRFFGQFSCMLATVHGNFFESAVILCEIRTYVRSGYYCLFFSELCLYWPMAHEFLQAFGLKILDLENVSHIQ